MHLVIISGASRPQRLSNTAKMIDAFLQGYEAAGNTSEVWYLSNRNQWSEAKAAFEKENYILLALPLYVENMPGIMLEFLTQLSPKSVPGTRMAFLLQGGFPEASQSRCCEKYLEALPAQLGCIYAGTLIKGDMFGIRLMDEKNQAKTLSPFIEMGRYFARTHVFDKAVVNEFARPEYMSAKEIRIFKIFGRPVQRIFMGRMAKKMGCKERLDSKPYAYMRHSQGAFSKLKKDI